MAGVPCLVNLAAMREAMAALGGDPVRVNPLRPAELVIDHSVIAAYFGRATVAVAVRRALSRASEWRDHDWQLIHDAPQDPALHMAIDEVLAGELAVGPRPSTLHIVRGSASPARPGVSLRCASKPACREPRSSTRWSAISATATGSLTTA